MTLRNRALNSALFIAAILLASPFSVYAQYAPKSLNISGGLFQPNGLPVTSTSVDFRIEIWDKNATCKLYEETHLAQNLSATKGGFSLQLGQGSSVTNYRDAGNATSLSWLVFANPGAPASVFAGCGGGVVFAAGDNRLIRVYYNLGSGMTAMTPDVPIESSAYAMVADTLEGKKAAEFIQVRDDVGTDLNQSNVETVFSATNYAKLLQLLNNTFAGSYGFNNQRITDVAAPTAGTDAVNRTWVDGHVGDKAADLTGVGAGTNNGHTLIWDAGNNRWTTGVPSAIDNSKLPLAGGTMSGPITMGGYDLYNTGHITMGNQRMLTLGRYTNAQEGALGLGVGDEGRMFYNTEMDAVRVWDGTGYIGFGASGVAGGDLTGSYPNPTIKAAAVTNTKIADDAVQSRNIDQAGIGMNRLVISDNVSGNALRFKTCALNQILRWEATGWQCVDPGSALPNTGIAAGMYGSSTTVPRIGLSATGVVTSATDVAINFPVVSVNGKTGVVVLNGADLGLGTASLEDVGNGANEVPMTDGTGKLNPSVIPTLSIGDISGAITQIVAGAGLTGGGTQGVVTLAVDLTQVDAYRLRGRDISSVAPADNEVLMWNALTNTWLPRAIPSAPVQTVAGRTGNVVIYADDITSGAGRYLTYAPNGAACSNGETLKWNGSAWLCGTDSDTTYTISGTNGALVSGPATNRTISIDTGVTTGQIVQVAAGNRLPVIDGSQLTNVSNLRDVNVSTAAPTSGQYLRYNGSAWEAATLVDNAGVTYVDVSSDLTGGPITATGTIGVNTGTGPNQILKLNGSSQIPAVDGSLLTFVSAASIRGVNVATTAPSANQVLKYNGSGWAPATLTPSDISGSITQIVAGSGLTGGGSSGVVTLGIDLTQVDAYKLRGRDISNVAPNDNEVLMWNALTNTWLSRAIPSAPVTTVAGRTGNVVLSEADISGAVTEIAVSGPITGGGIAGVVTIGLDANQVDAARIRGVNISTLNPSSGQVLKYNGSAWEAAADTDSGIVTIVGNNGALVSGPALTKTISIDTGVTTGQIVQVAAGDRLPVIDGSNLTQISNLRGVNVSTTAPSLNQVLKYNGSGWEAATDANSGGTVTLVAMGSGLAPGNITATGTISVDVGTGANQIVQLDGSARLPAVNGSQLTNVNAVQIQARDIAAAAPADNQVLTWNNAASRWEPRSPGAGADDLGSHIAAQNIRLNGNWLSGDGGAEGIFIPAAGNVGVGTNTPNANAILDINGLGSMSALLIPRDTAGNRPTGVPGMIRYNTSTAKMEVYEGTTWADVVQTPDGGITTLTGTNGALVSGTATVKTVSIDTGVTTGQIVQVAAGNRLPVIDGSNLTQISNLRNVNVSTATPTTNQVLQYNGSAWEATTLVDNAGVTYVATTTDLTGGPINGTGTLGVNTGTGANQILKLNGSSQIPVVDGSLLTNINAVRLNGNPVSATGLTTGYALKWNGSQWEPQADTDSGVVTIVGTNGALVSGPALTKTISIDTGVTTGQIVQVAAGNRLPAIDGSNLTQISNLRNVNVSTTTPTSNQVLRYNGSAWEAATLVDNAGVTLVTAGSGLLGGTVTTAGTISVDVGTGNNQIVQLDGSARLPAVNGSLLTNVNAVALQTYAVHTSAPADNQVLTWNATATRWEARSPGAGADNLGTHIAAQNIQLNGFWLSGDGGNEGIFVPAAGNVGVGTNTPNANAILDVNGAGAMSALLVPRDTAGNRPTGVPGMIRYNTSSAKMEVYEGTAWADVVQAPDGGITTLTGTNGALVSGTATVKTVSIDTGVTTGQIVQVAAGNRLPVIDGSNLTQISNLRGVNVSTTAPTNGQVLKYNGSGWAPAADDSFAVAAGTGILLSGPATLKTISVDVGIGANQIPQLNASGFLGIGTASVTAGAVAEFYGVTNLDSAVILPRATSANRPAGTNGMIRYNTSLAKFEVYENGNWYNMATGATGDNLGNHIATQAVQLNNQWLSNDGGAEGIRIDNNGLVGIGTSTISEVMNVFRDANSATRVSINNPNAGGSALSSVTLGSDIGSAEFAISSAAGGNYATVQSNAPSLTFHNYSATGLLRLTTNGVHRMTVNGAGGIAMGPNASPTTGALLDLNGTGVNYSSLLVPRDTTANRPTAGVNGMIRYNTNISRFEVYEGGSWVNMTAVGAGIGDFKADGSVPMTGNLRLNNNWLSNDGGSEGVRVNNDGTVVVTGNGSLVTRFAATASGPYGTSISLDATAMGSGKDWWINSTATGAGEGAGKLSFKNSSDNIFAMTLLPSGVVAVGTTSATAGAVLDVTGTGNLSSMIIPRGTTAERAVAASNGMIRYNTNISKFEVYEAGQWTSMATGSVGTGDFLRNGTLPMTGQFLSILGTANAPGMAFNGDTDTGIWSSGANRLAFSTGGTGRMTIDALGNLGIGTNAPVEKVQIADGNLAISGNNGGVIRLANGWNDSSWGVYLRGHDNGVNGHDFRVQTRATMSGPTADTLNVTSQGRVGIGTTSPASLLDVYGTGHVELTVTTAGGAGRASQLKFDRQGAGASYVGPSASNVFDVFTGENIPMIFSTNSQQRMILENNGQLGIGTTDALAGAILDLNGTGVNYSSVLVPRDTTANRPSTGVNGMIRYNTNTARFEAFEGGNWVNLTSVGAGTGDFKADGSVPMTGQFLSTMGTAGAPGLAFVGDADTGLWSNGTNRLALSTGGTGRLFVDSLGNVGIGTSDPAGWKVNIVGDLNATVSVSTDFVDAYRYALAGNWGTDITAPASQTMAFSTNSTERMRISNAGNVGIGTTSPNTAAVLDVNGTGNLSAMIVPRATTAQRPVTAANGMIRYNTNTSKFEVYANNAWADVATGSGGADNLGNHTATTNIQLGSNWLSGDGGSEGIRVDTNGNVGIGAAPDANNRLYFEDTKTATASGWQIGSRGYLLAAPGSAAAGDFIGFQSQVEQLNNINVTASFVGLQGITAKAGTGTLGRSIGVAGYPINVAGNTTIAAAVTASMETDAGTVSEYRAFESTAVYMPGGSITTAYGLWLDDLTGPGTVYGIYQKGQSDINYLNGRTGIGTGTPQVGTALDVRGTGVNYSSMLIPRDTSANRPTGVNGMIRYNTNTSKFEVYANNAWADVATGSGGSSQWTTVAGNEIHYSTANVGVGTADPAHKFHVHDSANDSEIAAFWNNGGWGEVAIGNGGGAVAVGGGNSSGWLWTNAAIPLRLGVNNAEQMRIASDGSVGIGTTSTSGKLHVAGTTQTYLDRADNNNNAEWALTLRHMRADAVAPSANFGVALSFDGEGFTNGGSANMALISAAWENNQTNNTTDRDGYLAFSTAQNNVRAERMRISSSGNVGIGTSTVMKQVDIVGPTGQQGVLGIKSLSGEGATIYFGTNNQYDGTGSNAAGAITYNDAVGGGFEFRTNNYSGDPNQSSKTRMTITSGGNVGIGTTAPVDKLELYNSANMDSSLYLTTPGTQASQQSVVKLITKADGSGIGTASNKGWVFFARGDSFTGEQNDFGVSYWNGASWLDPIRIDSATGNMGIGTTNPTLGRLQVENSGAVPIVANRTTNDGVIISLRQAGTEEGTISVAGTTMSYNAFTGSHYGLTSESIEKGRLVSLNGDNTHVRDNPDSEMVYGITETTTANAPNVLGAMLAKMDSSYPLSRENPYLVMAVGNGVMWVVENGEDLTPGDYLISSDVAGHAMRDNASFPVSHVVARVTERVNWALVTDNVNGRKRKLVNVTFEAFSKPNYVEQLRATVRKLEAETTILKEENAAIKAYLCGKDPNAPICK